MTKSKARDAQLKARITIIKLKEIGNYIPIYTNYKI